MILEARDSDYNKILIDTKDISEYGEKYKNTPIEYLDLSVRAYVCLTRAGVKTIGDLLAMTDEELRKVKNLKKKGVWDVKDRLLEHWYDERGWSE